MNMHQLKSNNACDWLPRKRILRNFLAKNGLRTILKEFKVENCFSLSLVRTLVKFKKVYRIRPQVFFASISFSRYFAPIVDRENNVPRKWSALSSSRKWDAAKKSTMMHAEQNNAILVLVIQLILRLIKAAVTAWNWTKISLQSAWFFDCK